MIKKIYTYKLQFKIIDNALKSLKIVFIYYLNARFRTN